jgi:BirA family biotin operon repressor/biotin-[acetyl-CoA-carboxylase] ligase
MFSVGEATKNWADTSQLLCNYQKTVGSTNTIAKDFASQEKVAIALYIADHQTEGRGRGENHWDDESAQSLLSSWSFQLPESPRPCLTARVGLAVFRALTSTWPLLPLSLKAPNDIYLGDKKLAGLLIENVQQGTKNRLVVGFGMNVFDSPKKVPLAVSLTSMISDSEDLNATTWESFLDRLLLELTLVVREPHSEIKSLERKLLLFSLNRFPGLSEKYTSVEADGSLRMGSKTIHWTEL